MKTRVVELMARKQLEVNVPIDATAIKEGTGLSRPTIAKWIKGYVHSFDERTILAFCRYFNCDIGDLLTIVDENGTEGK